MDASEYRHATSVVINRKSVLILGPSGSGKSTLAVRMISLGATLISDDQTAILTRNSKLIAASIPSISGKIEVRGVGILNVPFVSEAQIYFAVELGEFEEARLPPSREIELLGVKLPLYHRIKGDYFADALIQILKHGAAN